MPTSPPRHNQAAAPLQAGQALAGDSGFASLMQRMALSRQCLDAIKPLLGNDLQSSVRAGPLQDDVWSLLADNAACAAKLRQLVPRLQERLAERGLHAGSIRVKVSRRP